MGYRSDVRFSTTEEGFGYLKGCLKHANFERRVEYPLLGIDKDGRDHGFDVEEHTDGGVLFGFDEIKWHESYPGVAAFEKAFSLLDAAGYPWIRARIGEDFDDIEFEDGNADRDEGIPAIEISSGFAF